MIRGNFIFFLVFNICVVTRANGFVGLFANGKYGIMVFGWPKKIQNNCQGFELIFDFTPFVGTCCP